MKMMVRWRGAPGPPFINLTPPGTPSAQSHAERARGPGSGWKNISGGSLFVFFCATELRVQFRFPLKPLCWSILLGKTRVSSLDFTEIHWSYLCDIQKESENPKIVSSLSREVPLFDSWSPWMPHPRLPTHHPSSGWRKRQLQSGAPVR